MKGLLKSALLLLALLMICTALLCACNNTPPSGDNGETSGESGGASSGDNTISEETTEAPLTGEFRIVDNGVPVFTLVASDNATDAELEAVSEIRDAISTLTGVDPPLMTDWIRPGDVHDSEAYEILIGKTNYEESIALQNETSYGAYRVDVKGNKIVLSAWSEPALKKAVSSFISMMENAAQGNTIVLERSSIKSTAIVDHSIDHIPVVPNKELDHVYDANGAYEAIFNRATAEDFHNYIAKLDAEGYQKYASNERGKVLSATYIYEEQYTYNIFFEGGFNELCVVAERYDEEKLPPKEASYKKICEPQFAQLGLEYNYGSNKPQNGMCYIWRLEDGRFIILDGGFNYLKGATNLMETLKGMAIDPNDITIATWAISHFHGDHVGTLVSFVKNYLYKVEIESLLFNLPTLEQSKMSDMNWNYWNTINSQLKTLSPKTVVYKAHPGQIYHFADAALEILYTLEMTAPDNLTYYNTCSLIIDVKFDDFNMMMLGDCSTVTNANIFANYGEALEAEVVQVAHHGYDGGSTGLYEKINPIYVFWPAGGTWYSTCENNATENPATDRSAYFFLSGTRVDMIYPALARVIIMDIDPAVGFGFSGGKIYATIDDYIAGASSPAPLN